LIQIDIDRPKFSPESPIAYRLLTSFQIRMRSSRRSPRSVIKAILWTEDNHPGVWATSNEDAAYDLSGRHNLHNPKHPVRIGVETLNSSISVATTVDQEEHSTPFVSFSVSVPDPGSETPGFDENDVFTNNAFYEGADFNDAFGSEFLFFGF
jgi:hypothetical protein